MAKNNDRNSYRLMIAGLLISWVGVCCISAYWLNSSRQQAQENAEVVAENIALSLENFLHMHFEVTDRILRQAAANFKQETGGSFSPSTFSKELGQLQQLLPDNVGIRGSNEHGDVIYGVDLPEGKPLNIADRKFFDVAKQSGTLVFALPLKSRVTNSWVLPVVLSLQRSDGSFGGVVYVNTAIKTIADTFESVKVGKLGSVMLFDSDRRVYLRFPVPPKTHDEEVIYFGSPELKSIVATGKSEAIFQSTSTIDGVQRTAGLRQIGNYPLYILVGLGKDEYLAEWYRDVSIHIGFLLLLLASSSIFVVALKRSWRKREESLQKILLKEKQLERSIAALSSSEQRFRTLTEGLPLMSWVADAHRNAQFFSRQATEFAGCPMASLIENNGWINYVHPDDRSRMLEAWHLVKDSGAIYQTQCRVKRHDGVWRVIEVRGLPQRSSEGEIVAWVGCNYDVTEREEAQAERAAARATAESATLAKSAFLANMSHEIRTPMNGILGLAHLMRRGSVTPLQAQQLDKIAASGKHLLSVINDILDLSKIEAGKFVLVEEDFALDELISEISDIIGDSIHAKDLSLAIEMADMPQFLHGDSTRLRQALVNYLSNALKFTSQGSITLKGNVLEASEDDYLIRFSVSDTGIGIPVEHREKLFSAFEQADKSTTRKFGGTGLGLAITQRIARLMRGDVGFDSVPGQGSTFWLTVRLGKGKPVVSSKDAILPDGADTIIRNEHRGKRVLIAEDEPINQLVASALLEDVGLKPIIAENGVQALKMVEQQDFALILMDMQMPELDGVEATRLMRQIPGLEQVPILAMTANAFDEDREKCIQAGMNDFIIKPADPDVLFNTLLKWLRHGSDREMVSKIEYPTAE